MSSLDSFKNIKKLNEKVTVEKFPTKFVRIDIKGKRTLSALIDSWVLNGTEIELNRSYQKKGLYHIHLTQKDFEDTHGNLGSIEEFIDKVRNL